MPPGRAGSYLVHFTGSAEHNVALRHRARELGWSLSEHGLVPLDDDTAPPTTFATEAELYAFLGLAEIPPELREDRGEIEAAEHRGLPALVARTDLRGDCHSHIALVRRAGAARGHGGVGPLRWSRVPGPDRPLR